MILHDWPDEKCREILDHLRDAAKDSTKLIIIDNLISHACVDERIDVISGIDRTAPPAPLLPNKGHASAISYFTDMQMIELLNGRERTIFQVKELLVQTRWKLDEVVEGAEFSTDKVIATPVY